MGTLIDTFFPRAALRTRQRAFAAARESVREPDDVFLQVVCGKSSGPQAQLALGLRELLAKSLTCRADSVRAADSTRELHTVMGDASFVGWFITLGDLGPEETFFFEVERTYEKIAGLPAYLDLAVQYQLRDAWESGYTVAEWIRSVLAALDEASRRPVPMPRRRSRANR